MTEQVFAPAQAEPLLKLGAMAGFSLAAFFLRLNPIAILFGDKVVSDRKSIPSKEHI
jgi:hypothetical protein